MINDKPIMANEGDDTAQVRPESLSYHTPTPMAASDEHGIFVWVNPAFCKLLGYCETELVGKPITNFLDPDSVKTTHEVLSNMNMGKPLHELINVYIHKNGKKVVLRWSGKRDPENGILYGSATDVSEAFLQ